MLIQAWKSIQPCRILGGFISHNAWCISFLNLILLLISMSEREVIKTGNLIRHVVLYIYTEFVGLQTRLKKVKLSKLAQVSISPLLAYNVSKKHHLLSQPTVPYSVLMITGCNIRFYQPLYNIIMYLFDNVRLILQCIDINHANWQWTQMTVSGLLLHSEREQILVLHGLPILTNRPIFVSASSNFYRFNLRKHLDIGRFNFPLLSYDHQTGSKFTVTDRYGHYIRIGPDCAGRA